MVMKSFDYLLSQFNSLNTLLRKKRRIAYVLGRPHDKFSGLVVGFKWPSMIASPIVFD